MSDESERDAGAYIGNEPELAQDTIRGGLSPKDERVAGEATQSSGPAQQGANPEQGYESPPEGHAVGLRADDDQRRRAGSNE